ncbi:uncharacterized protein haspin [Oreochromis aureus]|uniref:uncharacterized protein haspin n=1 Tax=Oreochromis aureus TaxID=47969 RepID=UPI0012BC8691|nr:uncharacterized protein haspin [Oreochromis aureus]
MKPVKPLYLKTYGKQRRKVSAWISPEDRKQAFDSTPSSSDVSVFEPSKPQRIREKRTNAVSDRTVRPAKKKAILCLTEKSVHEGDMSNEENAPPLPPPAQQSRTARRKKSSVASCRAVRPAKRKTISRITETSSDEENSRMLAPPPPSVLTQQSKTTRTSRLVSGHRVLMKRRGQQVSVTTESEEETSAPKGHRNSDKMRTNSNVYPRSAGRFVTQRRRAAAIVPKASVSILSSSDDFTSTDFPYSRPSRKRKMPPALGPSSAENSMSAPFREISLNELADCSLGPCPRKPIFCSTPSAGSFSKRGKLKPFSVNDLSCTPPSMSVNGIVSPPDCSLHCQQIDTDLPDHIEPSIDLFSEPKRRSESKSKNEGELQSANLLSADSGSSSQFVSAAAGGLDWLIETLKEKCLSTRCTVPLEKLDLLAEPSSETTYSSCLGHSSSLHSRQTNEQPVDSGEGVDLSESLKASFCLHVSGTVNDTGDSFDQEASVSQSCSTNISPLVNSKQSVEHSTASPMEQSESVLYVQSIHHTDSSSEIIMSTHLESSSTVQTVEGKAIVAKSKSLTKRCSVQMKNLVLSQEQLKGFSKQTEEDSGKTQSAKTECAADLTAGLKEKCLTDKLIVGIKRVNLSQLKEILRPKGTLQKPAGDVPDSASDDQTKTDHLPESDDSKETTASKASVKNERLTTSEDETASDREVVKKRKKMPVAQKEKKQRSASADRPGTMRKACVSGMSVSRWKNKGNASTHVIRSRAADCSINEMIPSQHKQPREFLGSTMNFSTPVKASRLNLSSLLADFTPNTKTWSRIKAALSVHRKGLVLLTPRSLRQSASGSPGRTDSADLSRDLFTTPLRTPLPKRLRSQLLDQHSLVCEDADLSDAEKVYAECGQQHPLRWEECILPQRMKQCLKIGEGTFGEVFSTNNESGDTVALKIIPVEGSEKVNGEDQKTFGEILHEIIISKELSSLKEKQHNQTHGFIGLKDLHCVQGCYPADFLKAWDTFDQQKGSENDRPDFFENDQIFIILEFEFGGIDLENSNGTLASLAVAKSILHQVTAALAVAEQELHFEHRDLHWGNVLVKTTKQKTGSFLINGTTHSLETRGVLVRIIDYSLSRLEIDDLTVSCDISNDEELFMGQGDYQFEIYRLMRQENGNNWAAYHPHTNVLWLHYLCSKLLSMKYRGSGGRSAKDVREELTGFYDNVLQYSSATEALQSCPMFQ